MNALTICLKPLMASPSYNRFVHADPEDQRLLGPICIAKEALMAAGIDPAKGVTITVEGREEA